MGWLTTSSLVYGVLNVLFGVIGFVNAKSVPSLVAGGVAGVLVVIGATLSRTHRSVGFGIVAVVSVLILGRFFKGAFVEGKVYPAMILALASIVMLVLLTIGHFLNRSQNGPRTGTP